MSKPGMLVSQFSTEAGFGSWAIRYLSAGSVSHVDLVIPVAVAIKRGYLTRRYQLLGARLDGGVQLRSADYAKFTRTAWLGCVVPDIDAAYDFAFAQIGKPYAKRKIVDFFLHRFGKDRVYEPAQADWFCDELDYEIYKAGGVELLDTDNPRNLSPECVMLSPLLQTQQAV